MHVRLSVLVHSQGMQAVPGKKWAFFIYSGLMTTSSATLGEPRTTDNQKHQPEANFLLQGLVSQMGITHFLLQSWPENWWKDA